MSKITGREVDNFFTPTVKSSGSAYTAVAWDMVIITTGAAYTVTLPAAPVLGDQLYIIDGNGVCATTGLNITIDGNGKNINGLSSLTVAINYASIQLVYNGTQWNVI